MFPVEKMKRGRVSVHCINSVEIFCSCQIPIKGKMIECCGCKEWYHLACVVDVPERGEDELDYVQYFMQMMKLNVDTLHNTDLMQEHCDSMFKPVSHSLSTCTNFCSNTLFMA